MQEASQNHFCKLTRNTNLLERVALYRIDVADYTKAMESQLSHANRDEGRFRLLFFSALCLFLSMVEYAIPKPLPFLRLGLANLPILLAFSKLKIKEVALLVVIKTLVQGLISGTLFSYVFLFSAAGSSAATLSMGLLYYGCIRNRKHPLVSLVGMSVAGALGNNGAQLLVARYLIFGTAARYIAPVLLCSGLVTGLLLGLFAQKFVSISRWYKSLEAVA